MTTEDKTTLDGMSEAPAKFEHAASAASTKTRQDEHAAPSFSAVLELEGKRIDPKEWASHILHINIACEALAQDPEHFEKRVRETMSTDGSEWVEEIDSLTTSHENLTAVASVLNSANARILLALGRIAGVDQDEDADQAGPDNNAPKGKPSARRAQVGHATTGRSGMPDGVKGTFLTLVEELDDIKDVANNMVPGAAYYVLIERAQELDEEMLETRPETLAGVVWKLKELTRLLDNEPDISVYERRLAHSVMADVETLAAGQAKQV